MEKNSILGLSKQLETKKKQDREQIEKHTLSELKRHARHLRDGLSDELVITKNDISDRLNQIARLLSDLETASKNRSQKTWTSLTDDLKAIERASSQNRKAITNDLKAIKAASSQNRQAALNSMRWGWLKYSLPALLVLLTILGANWGAMQWQSSRLISMQEQINQAQQTLSQLPEGVRFAVDGAGKSYLVFENEPQIFRTQSGEWATELNR